METPGLRAGAVGVRAPQLLRDLAPRFRSLIDSVPPARWHAPVRGVPGWSIRDLATHVATGTTLYLEAMQDHRLWYVSVDDVARRNRELLERARGLSDDEVRQQLSSGPNRLADHVEADPHGIVPFHFGSRVPRHLIAASMVGELAVHGFDVARTVGRPWRIEAPHADVVLARNVALLDTVMRRDRAAGLCATYELVVRGGSTHHVRIEDGRATGDVDHGARIDCRMSGTGEAWLLVTNKRRSAARFLLTGALRATGRRPWLANRLDRLVDPI